MDVCVISAGLHILSRQSIPIKASCNPGDCRGAVLRWIKSPFENNQDWLIVAGRERGIFQAGSEPEELETTMC